MAIGCSGAYSGTYLSMDSATGEIQADQDTDYGYEETVCVKCLGLNGVDFTTYDGWKVEQEMNCGIALRGSELAKRHQNYLFGYVDTNV